MTRRYISGALVGADTSSRLVTLQAMALNCDETLLESMAVLLKPQIDALSECQNAVLVPEEASQEKSCTESAPTAVNTIGTVCFLDE